jgi:hypothetical protein
MAPDVHLGARHTQPRPLCHVTPRQVLPRVTLVLPAGDSDTPGPASLFRGGGHAYPTHPSRQPAAAYSSPPGMDMHGIVTPATSREAPRAQFSCTRTGPAGRPPSFYFGHAHLVLSFLLADSRYMPPHDVTHFSAPLHLFLQRAIHFSFLFCGSVFRPLISRSSVARTSPVLSLALWPCGLRPLILRSSVALTLDPF